MDYFERGEYVSELHKDLEMAKLKKDFFIPNTLLLNLLKDAVKDEMVSNPITVEYIHYQYSTPILIFIQYSRDHKL